MKKYIICVLGICFALVVGICGILVNNEREINRDLQIKYTEVCASLETLNLAYDNLYEHKMTLQNQVNFQLYYSKLLLLYGCNLLDNIITSMYYNIALIWEQF